MSEIAVARLHIDERKTGVPRQTGRHDEVVHEAVQLVICHHANAIREAAIEQWVRSRGSRLRAIVDVRTRIPARMRQLKTDGQIAIGVDAKPFAVRGKQIVAQRGN